MNATSEHRKQIDSGISASLSGAGIGVAYHRRSLTELSVPGAALADWVKGAARSDIAEGRGYTFVGAGANVYDAAILTARALHLSGVKTRYASLKRLLTWLTADGEEAEAAHGAAALFVTDFHQQYKAGVAPLTAGEVMTVETFLTERLDNNRALFPVCTLPLGGPASLWSPTFCARVNRANKTLEVRG